MFWRGFLASRKRRGPSGVLLVINDQHAGLVAPCDTRAKGPGTSGVGCTSRDTWWRTCPSHTPTWSRRCSARSAPSPIRSPPPRREMRSAISWQDLVDQSVRAGEQGDPSVVLELPGGYDGHHLGLVAVSCLTPKNFDIVPGRGPTVFRSKCRPAQSPGAALT